MPACSSVIVLRAGIQSCKHMIVCVYVCIFILAWCIYVCVCVCVCACVRASTPSFSSFHVLLLPIRGSGCVRGGGVLTLGWHERNGGRDGFAAMSRSGGRQNVTRRVWEKIARGHSTHTLPHTHINTYKRTQIHRNINSALKGYSG